MTVTKEQAREALDWFDPLDAKKNAPDHRHFATLRQFIEQSASHRGADAKDAERYRWMRQAHPIEWPDDLHLHAILAPGMFDAAIDEAMGSQGSGHAPATGGVEVVHPMHDGIESSVLTSADDQHRLTINYATREQADRAQEWLAGDGPTVTHEVGVKVAPTPLDPVDGDVLQPLGTRVLAHHAREDEWREQTVVGYYVWPDLGGNKRLSRVFLRLRDDEGWMNARMLCDVKPAPGVALPDGWRKCEFCGCNTNAALRACCNKGREADRSAGVLGIERTRLPMGWNVAVQIAKQAPNTGDVVLSAAVVLMVDALLAAGVPPWNRREPSPPAAAPAELTDERITALYDAAPSTPTGWIEFARAIEREVVSPRGVQVPDGANNGR